MAFVVWVEIVAASRNFIAGGLFCFFPICKMFRRALTRIEIKLDDIKEFEKKKKKAEEASSSWKDMDTSSQNVTLPRNDDALAPLTLDANQEVAVRRMRLGYNG